LLLVVDDDDDDGVMAFVKLVFGDSGWLVSSNGVIPPCSPRLVVVIGIRVASLPLARGDVSRAVFSILSSLPAPVEIPWHSEAWDSRICQPKERLHNGHTPKPLPPFLERKLPPDDDNGRGRLFRENAPPSFDAVGCCCDSPLQKYEVRRFCLPPAFGNMSGWLSNSLLWETIVDGCRKHGR
jgi:hypothetical protein